MTQIQMSAIGQLAKELPGFDPEARPTEGYDPQRRCYLCKTCWYDHRKGVIVPCSKCCRSYHQDCHVPTIKSCHIEGWVCSVCDLTETQLCVVCHEPFTQQECTDPRSLENNELVQCARCSQWWHQACHQPAVYPLPIQDFWCYTCCNAATTSNKEAHVLMDHVRCSHVIANQPNGPNQRNQSSQWLNLNLYL